MNQSLISPENELVRGMHYWCKFHWSTSYDIFQYKEDGFFYGIGSDEYISFIEFEDIYPVCGARHNINLSLI